MTLPTRFRDYLAAPGLTGLWQQLRARLERTGHSLGGSIRTELDTDAAERLSGLLGRRIPQGRRTVSLEELDAALRRSVAARGLVPVVADLTGGPLRDRPSERLAHQDAVTALWAQVDRVLAEHGLTSAPWVQQWTRWLHATGLLMRAPETARVEFAIAAHAVATALDPVAPPRMLGQLATLVAGDAHALDNDRLAGRLALRALSFAFDQPDPVGPRDRIAVWQLAGITADTVSGTVLTWGLRPPGNDPWSVMMCSRAELGLVTHLTVAELSTVDVALTVPGDIVAACENPQVLQRAVETRVRRPLVCFSGNPSSAGVVLADRIRLRYHGDFDWPGIAIAGRLQNLGAQLWRMSAQDYLDAVELGTPRLPLAGNAVPTPWDPELSAVMSRTNLAVHEEAVLDLLIADLR
ncbi:TIGR02679 family protein [Nocardia shimofusensis]|uniref:TIGR02679 family protein n=1 Tax=Nocardia shimofusensis TaxID=228596 RepID=UPI000834AA81|nr:TIGR02679 family protein [Nocardia shimofusensis]